ncbi:MAG: sulfite exporter TauE/SafE family protein [Phycisphaeraceae bacterium]|nr:sulfite exporter TauE/SafE family protein [Phycisphaeraceae bacterium]
MTTAQIIGVLLLGLGAGTLGGLAGIGGSLVVIPGLALLLGYHDPSHAEQHLYIAAAMSVNVVVAIPAVIRHRKAEALRWELVRVITPVMAAAIAAGVLISNLLQGDILRLLLAGFIAVYCVVTVTRLVRDRPEPDASQERTSHPRLILCGSVTGLISGTIGLGGGIILVPLLQLVSRVHLRQAVATSLTVMPITAAIGATLKLITLASHDLSAWDALGLSALMAPAAVVGGYLGASLSHALPLRAVRIVISSLLLLVAIRLVLAFGGPEEHVPRALEPS